MELGRNIGLVFEMRSRSSMARALNTELSPGLATSGETVAEQEVSCLPWALLRGSNGVRCPGCPAHTTNEIWQNGKLGAGLPCPPQGASPHLSELSRQCPSHR